ncbi:hypothetical protein B9Z55_024914 [Caenorhabditis nigoni]|uniref:Uncharacterized protein n=1 Tax=Caenorhabditis nigoni TaxID=1611254 RepID=A0A2G5SW18_9PELO|nr:hypothetical protein B9Z55_024914 [Caenorhabditis nigoni]
MFRFTHFTPFRLFLNHILPFSADPTESKDIARNNPKIVRRLLSKLDQLKKFLHKNVRKPLSLSGSPERFNGSYSSFWCDGQA